MNTRPFTLLALLACAGAAIAQPPPPPPPRDQPRQPDPLRGPEVRDRQVPGVNNTFGEPGGEKKRFVGENKLPPRVFRDAMETVLSPDAPDNLRVTDEQRARFRSWMDDFQKSVGDYMKEHQQELRELRAKTGDGAPGRRPAGKAGPGAQPRPPQGDEMRPEPSPQNEKDAAAARERFQALMQGAPKIEDLYTKIWTELKPDQQKAVDEKLAQFRAQQVKEREENYVRQRAKKKPDGQPPQGLAPGRAPDGQVPGRPRGGPPGAPPRGDAAARGQGIDPQRRDRLIRLFSQLTPEQQEQLLARLERARDENGGVLPQQPLRRPGGRFAPQGPGEPKPAPQPDDSMLPPRPAEPAQPAGNPPRQP